MLKILMGNCGVYSDLTKLDPLSTLKTLCVSYFVNRNIEWLQRIKATSLMKLAVVTAKQSILVNLSFFKIVFRRTKDLSRILWV